MRFLSFFWPSISMMRFPMRWEDKPETRSQLQWWPWWVLSPMSLNRYVQSDRCIPFLNWSLFRISLLFINYIVCKTICWNFKGFHIGLIYQKTRIRSDHHSFYFSILHEVLIVCPNSSQIFHHFKKPSYKNKWRDKTKYKSEKL